MAVQGVGSLLAWSSKPDLRAIEYAVKSSVAMETHAEISSVNASQHGNVSLDVLANYVQMSSSVNVEFTDEGIHSCPNI